MHWEYKPSATVESEGSRNFCTLTSCDAVLAADAVDEKTAKAAILSQCAQKRMHSSTKTLRQTVLVKASSRKRTSAKLHKCGFASVGAGASARSSEEKNERGWESESEKGNEWEREKER
eukprot:6050881-Pleurochrysis_carterae.AAC.4